MKVGILTYHFGGNYGGVLQCLALQTAVEQLGHEVEVIDFFPTPQRGSPIWRGWQIHRHGFSCVPTRVIQLRYGKKLLNEFDRFRQHQLKLSPRVVGVDALKGIASNYDAIITGSDQVWNFRCSPGYFLALGESFRGRKIAYAPCCTQEEQPDERIGEVGNWIKDYNSISVRDAFSKRVVESASGREAQIVCDPTLLMDQQWLTGTPGAQQGGHILVYRLGRGINGDMDHCIKWLMGKTGATHSEGVVTSASNPHTSPETEIKHFTLPPQQWVSKIKTARFVLTDSFHGALFAMRLGTPFIAYCTEINRSPRLADIAERYGLGNRIVTSARDLECVKADALTHSVETTIYMRDHVAESRDFLRNALV